MNTDDKQLATVSQQDSLQSIRQIQPQISALLAHLPTRGLQQPVPMVFNQKWNNWNSDDGPKSP